MLREDRPGTIYPGLFYDDPLTAIDWLCRAFGFESHLVVPGEGREVMHAELSLGSGCVMLGSANLARGWLSPRALAGVNQSVSIYLPDVDDLFARAVAAGATVVVPLEDTDYGSRGFVVTDPEGHFWNFGTYRPGDE